MAYVGNPIDTTNTFQSLQGKRFDGDGSTTDFTLDVAPSSTLDIEVFVGNVRQDPNSAYTLSGTTLTFTGAPPSGTNNIYVVHQAKSVGTIDVPDDIISGKTLVTLDNSNDHVLIEDATDGELKKALIPAASFAGIDDQSSSNDDQLTITDTAVVINEDSDDVDFRVETNGNANMLFISGGNDVVGIGAEGDLGVGLHVKSADAGGGSIDGNGNEIVIENDDHTGITMLVPNDKKGNIYFADPDASAPGVLRYDHNNNSMQFHVNASERMRIDSTGRVKINNTDSNAHLQVYNTGNATYTAFFRGNSTETVMLVRSNSDSGNNRTVDFVDQDGTLCGSINVNAGGNTVSYETSSDYRLKENVIDLTNATTRIKNLKPKRFNFKAKPDTTLDGFLAHEVQSVIPEAASGTKDATETKKNVVVNNKGNVEHEGVTEEDWKQGKIDEKFANDTQWFAEKEFIKPQGVDTSKLVPLLTAALQEAVAKIEALEARVTTLEG
jgi:hypothetical protein